MEIKQLEIKMAEVRGEVKTLREVFEARNSREADQFSSLHATVEKIDDKTDRLLIREATRKGEMQGFRRSAVILATLVSVLVSVMGLAVRAYVGIDNSRAEVRTPHVR